MNSRIEGSLIGKKNNWRASRKQSFLDPRTKLFLLITFPTFLMGGAGREETEPFFIIFPLLAFLLLLKAGNIRASITGFAVLAGTEMLWHFMAPGLTGALYTLLYILYGIVIAIIPCALMSVYALTTTTVSEFVAGMEKLHISNLITIPLSVMFRFFPTVSEEIVSINHAMNMRGIRFGSEGASRILEYKLIPVMMCSLRIGDELSAASLTRGLGAPIKRTNICKIGFKVQDIFVIILCISAYVTWMLGLLGVYLW